MVAYLSVFEWCKHLYEGHESIKDDSHERVLWCNRDQPKELYTSRIQTSLDGENVL